MIEIRPPQTPDEWARYFELRWQVLRAPWNQPRGSEQDAMDVPGPAADASKVAHMSAFDAESRALACARSEQIAEGVAQVRYMAVAPGQQGTGIGRQVLEALEKEANRRGARKIMLQARENAIGFYERMGYRMVEKTYLLFDEIQHWRMEKELE